MSLPQNNTLPIPSDESNGQPQSKQTTCCALLTGAGRSAIAVIEIWGERAAESVATFFRTNTTRAMDVGQVRFGVWSRRASSDQARSAGESIVVVPTAEQSFELHCHGGPAAIRRIIDDLSEIDVRQVAPRRLSAIPTAALHSVEDDVDRRLADEACDVLSRCTTVKTAAIALDQVRGALRQWRRQSIGALADRSRDAADSDAADSDAADIARQAEAIATAGRIGIRLTQPFDVVLAGPPNVGKSSLINAMVGYDRSITMDFAGTTRDVLDADTVFDGWPLRLRDTAGLHASDDTIEQQGIDRAMHAIATADLVVQVSAPGLKWDPTAMDAIRRVAPAVRSLQVINKSDLSPAEPIDSSKDALATVATTGQGVRELLETMIRLLAADTPLPGSPVPINQRQRDWVAEIARLGQQPDAMLARLTRGEQQGLALS
ncbi:GTPase [Rhodopirellula sp. JC639]|uniref:GTPase n=1 Tax=Stieleria mannarensis TaxID=2755585 RepID=UPI001602EECF|nr:GTPase [Rhodopirellula sp. JC639]